MILDIAFLAINLLDNSKDNSHRSQNSSYVILSLQICNSNSELIIIFFFGFPSLLVNSNMISNFYYALGVGFFFGPGTVQGSPLRGFVLGDSRLGCGFTFGFGITNGSVMLGCVFIVIRF